MHEELGTEPGFYYLYDKAAAAPAPDARAPRSRTRRPGAFARAGVEPWHQKHWDWKAAGNFMCGGAGAGLFAFAAIAGLDGSRRYWRSGLARAGARRARPVCC